MLLRFTLMVLVLSACGPQAQRPEPPQATKPGKETPTPAEAGSSDVITQSEMEKIVQRETAASPVVSPPPSSATTNQDLRQQVAVRVAGMKTRDGSALSPSAQNEATTNVMNLVTASQSRDVLAMTSAAQSLTQLLNQVNAPAIRLVDGAALAQAIQDLVAAAINADVAGILDAVDDIVAAATA